MKTHKITGVSPNTIIKVRKMLRKDLSLFPEIK